MSGSHEETYILAIDPSWKSPIDEKCEQCIIPCLCCPFNLWCLQVKINLCITRSTSIEAEMSSSLKDIISEGMCDFLARYLVHSWNGLIHLIFQKPCAFSIIAIHSTPYASCPTSFRHSTRDEVYLVRLGAVLIIPFRSRCSWLICSQNRAVGSILCGDRCSRLWH